MDCEEDNGLDVPPLQPLARDDESRSAVNSLILDYYKKFGRKRDLEQYFSLSTAQSDIQDPASVFWARMKAENESSDSGEKSDKKSVSCESSHELCRISISFPARDPYTSQEEDSKTKTESVSPPIIIEEVSPDSRQHSEDETIKSDDNNSQKSYDVILDTSANKPHSPSSSITSQRKLEWDSLADVGYANESDRKTSASTLSTLERLALKQQYSNNDTQNNNLGPPTAHSTPLEENPVKLKGRKGGGKKTTKIHNKDIDFIELNMPHSSNMNPGQSINVNLTKHISFNVEKDGQIRVERVQKDISVSPEKSIEEAFPSIRFDKEIQTSLIKTTKSNVSPIHISPNHLNDQSQPRLPIVISLNSLKRRLRRKKLRTARRRIKARRRKVKENIPVQEKSGEQLSEAESFEYMPGHIYNQNQMSVNNRHPNSVDNKSSLESSGVPTTDSSKASKHSFAKDLEKSIDILKSALQQRCDDSTLRKQLIKQVCQRLIKTQYRDDDSTTDFLSGLSYSSKKLGLGERNNTTTSTSDANNSEDISKRPKKSILWSDKFNPGSIASTSQSVPNLPIATKSEKPVISHYTKKITTSNTESDMSSKEKLSDNVFAKTSSEELYRKYLQALKREQAYKRHLKEKEMFLRQKLVSSDNAFTVPIRAEVKSRSRLKDLMNDLTRNNYDDGSGDASRLEGGPGSSVNLNRYVPNRNQRSHSVFTLSSGNSEKKPNLKKSLQCNIRDLSKPGPSKNGHYCCCPHHSEHNKVGVTDSSVQCCIDSTSDPTSCLSQNKVIKKEQKIDLPRHRITEDVTNDNIRYVCLCNNKVIKEVPEKLLIYKCSRLSNKGIQSDDTSKSNEVAILCSNQTCNQKNMVELSSNTAPANKSSQTNVLFKMVHQSYSDSNIISADKNRDHSGITNAKPCQGRNILICEATRCIQTEISINPKISDPTLSDIVIISDKDCVKLISEQNRQVSKPSITESKSCQPASSSGTSKSCTSKSSGTSKDADIGILEEDNLFDLLESDKDKKYVDNQNIDVEQSENYKIPIQGTNMTLMVSIGSERAVSDNKEIVKTTNQSIGTDRVKIIEQATIMTQECSTQAPSDKLKDPESTDYNSNKLSITPSSYTVEMSKSSIYPKTSVTSGQQLICDDLDQQCYAQTDIPKTKNAGTQIKVPVETQTEDLKQNNKCKCGCNQILASCNEKCSYYKDSGPSGISKTCSCENPNCKGECKRKCQTSKDSSPRKFVKPSSKDDDDNKKAKKNPVQSRKVSLDLSVQKCLSEDKCSCGCGGNKNACNKNCPAHKSLPKTFDRGTATHSYEKIDTFEKETEKCSCGCEGTKENCLDSCSNYKYTPREENKDQPSEQTSRQKSIASRESTPRENKRQSGQTCSYKQTVDHRLIPRERGKAASQKVCGNISPKNDGEQCICGCGGKKNNCKNNCPEILKDRSIKRRGECKIYSAQIVPEKANNMCTCGCGGTKDKCKKDCTVLEMSPRRSMSPNNVNAKKEVGTQKYLKDDESPTNQTKNQSDGERKYETSESLNTKNYNKSKKSVSKVNTRRKEQSRDRSPHRVQGTSSTEGDQTDIGSDPILDMIQSITKRYSKKDIDKSKRQKCFKEIMSLMTYLLDTETNESKVKDKKPDQSSAFECTTTADETDTSRKTLEMPVSTSANKINPCSSNETKKLVDKGVQPPKKIKKHPCLTESSDQRTSTDVPATSTDSNTCKVLNKIQRECEKFQQKRKAHSGRKCDPSCSTSKSCDRCKRVQHCSCRTHKCLKKCNEKAQKSSVAYNLILQTSESVSDGTVCADNNRQLRNIVVKVPKKKAEYVPFGEMAAKFERNMYCSIPPPCERPCRSRSVPNESEFSSMDEILRKSQGATVREYLEKNRPDFVEKCGQRQSCLKYISDSRWQDSDGRPNLKMVVIHTPNCTGSCNTIAEGSPNVPIQCVSNQGFPSQSGVMRIANERAVKRDLLSLYMAQLPDVTDLDYEDLRRLAQDLGRQLRKRQPAPKFISERDMKKHSEKIYKSLPEVVQKKEAMKKDNIKKTNLLMANIFKKNLQKKTLRGSVNLSNYSTIIKF